MILKVWDLVRQFTLFVGEAKTYPMASAQVFVCGPRGYVYSIIGKDFFAAIPDMWAIFKKYGLTSLEGPTIPVVAQILKETLEAQGVATVSISEPQPFEGMMLPYIVVTIK